MFTKARFLNKNKKQKSYKYMGQILNNWNMGNRWNGPDKHNFFWSPAKKRLCYILVMHWQIQKQCWWSGFWLVLLCERSWVQFPWPSKISKYFWSTAQHCHVSVVGPTVATSTSWDPHGHVTRGGTDTATSSVVGPTCGTHTAMSAVVGPTLGPTCHVSRSGPTCGTHLPHQQ